MSGSLNHSRSHRGKSLFDLPNHEYNSERFSGRLSIAISLILTILGLALVGYYYTGLKSSAEKFQFAASDNVTWTIAQIEVDYQNLRYALARGVISSKQGDSIDIVEIKRAFDIYYSRVDAAKFIYGGAFSTIEQGPGAILHRLSLSKNEIAQEIDTWIAPSGRDLVAMLAKVKSAADDIRHFTTQALQVLVADAAVERIGHLTILHRYASLVVLIMCLLFGMLAVSLVLQRRLTYRAIETDRAADNLKRIIEASKDGVVIADSTGAVLQYNKSAQDIFGYTPAEAIGAKMEELFIPDRHHQAHQNGMENYLATGHGEVVNKGRQVMTACDKSGREIPVEVTIAASKDGNNGVIFIGIIRDISSRIKNEKKLKVAVETAKQDALAKQRFLALMSHEMRTPLQGVLATFDLLDDSSASDSQRKLIDLGKRSGAKALRQVSNTLELARLTVDHPFHQSDIINPAASLKELVALMDPLLLQQGNTINLSFPTDHNIQIYGNQSLFDAIFENLLANANKFTKSGHLNVNMQAIILTSDEIDLKITVQDSGVGIAEDKLGNVFDDFATAGTGGIHSVESTGLGLGIVKRATEKMGGQITVSSTVGVGSAFTFSCRFRAAQPQKIKPRARSSHDDSLNQMQEQNTIQPLVLVVNDNEINQILIGSMLERLGCNYECAKDGLVAAEKCSSTSYDLILMDLSMPNLDGIEATHAILQLQIEQGPIVCITAQAAEDTLQTIQKAGMVDLITKPIRLETLAELLQSLLFSNGQAGGVGELPPSRMFAGDDAIDTTPILDLIDELGHDYATSLLQQFELTIRTELTAIFNLLEKGQMDKAAGIFHGAAGSAGMLGARALSNALLALESITREDHLRPDDHLLSSCDDLLADFVLAAESVQLRVKNEREKSGSGFGYPENGIATL